MKTSVSKNISYLSTLKKTVTFLLVLCVLLTQFGCSLFNKTSKLESLVKSGKYDEALKYYQENRTDISKDDATTIFETALDKMFQEYLENKIDSDGITDYVKGFEKVQSDMLDSYGKNILVDVSEIEESRGYFEKAEKAFADEDYIIAIDYYGRVIKNDLNYTAAQEKITDCRDSYKSLKLTDAKNYADKEHYLNAIKSLKDASAIVGDDKDIDKLLSDYQAKYDKYIYDSASSLANDKKYDEAIKLLSDNRNLLSDAEKCDTTIASYKDIAVQELLSSNNVSELIADDKYEEAFNAIESIKKKYPDSELLKKTIEDISQKFIEYEFDIIDGFIENSDYESAFNECEKALRIMPNNSDLVNKKNYIEARLPVKLMDLYVSSQKTGGNIWIIDGNSSNKVSDFYGNEYENGFVFKTRLCDSGFGYAEFYTNKKFESVKGACVVCIRQMEENTTAELRIYGDDELLFEKSITNRSTPDELFDVDIIDVDWLKIEISIDGGYGWPNDYPVAVAVVNAQVYYE